eukprot:TRINITY_DN5221_c3_g1_i4.p1 TRINITY_DN5221_c3_g1~~TRINITY_DN5221_c3_g1_i4.p1  ORF type:complete len:814 (+),score=134.23 TRINITY_DN5221_c3_g1_i4:76-2517(+)
MMQPRQLLLLCASSVAMPTMAARLDAVAGLLDFASKISGAGSADAIDAIDGDGGSLIDAALALTMQSTDYQGLFNKTVGESGRRVPFVEALGREGIAALLWSEEFMKALQTELQESDILSQVMSAGLLTESLAGKGVIVGVSLPIPGLSAKSVKHAEILSFEEADIKMTSPPSTPVETSMKRHVDKIMSLMDTGYILNQIKGLMRSYMSDSAVLRRGCGPAAMSRVMKGMKMTMRIHLPLTSLKVTSELTDITGTADDHESRACLAGVASEQVGEELLPSDFGGKTAFRAGFALKFAKGLGVAGFRYMIQQMKVPLIRFLSSSGMLKDVMQAPLLQRLLGGLVMHISVTKSVFGALGGQVASVKCVCDGPCPSVGRGQIDNPRHNINKGVSLSRCRSSSSGSDLSLPCCISSEFPSNNQPVCIELEGYQEKFAKKRSEAKSMCRLLGPTWHVSSRCMPSDPVLKVPCSGNPGACEPGIGQFSEDETGIAMETLQALEASPAFKQGELVAKMALLMLSGKQEAGSFSELLMQFMGRSGFEAMFSTDSMAQAMREELSEGPLLETALTTAKLTELMANLKMSVIMPVAGLQTMTLIAFQPSAHSPIPFSSRPSMQRNSAQGEAGNSLAMLLHGDKLMRTIPCKRASSWQCFFVDSLVEFLRTGDVLIGTMHEEKGRILNKVMRGRRIVMEGLNLILNSTVEGLEKADQRTRVRECAKAKGSCRSPKWCQIASARLPPGRLPPKDLSFVASLKTEMAERIGKLLGAKGLAALINVLREPLLKAMQKKGGMLKDVMTVDFVRKLMQLGNLLDTALGC